MCRGAGGRPVYMCAAYECAVLLTLFALFVLVCTCVIRRYKTFSFILENYPTLTRVLVSFWRAVARRKNVHFPFPQVDGLGHFCSVLRIALEGNFWVKTACQSGVFF